jgi:hypothetical protein
LSIVGFGALLTQLDDDDQDFVVAYVNQSNNKRKAKYNSYMSENALQLFGLFHHSNIIFMVAHSFWLLITSL